ncbi:DNRLRE domain-containing protein [Pinibacter aurantiacus]|uniref:DNRLRE domain-containing protein n=1 Tax=Pinibacter aurantiacus TaxID=2851599 RepID=A0A9E2SCU2_9BACT|nr:DNRLRE domain-containing protein [Pinibacter aurantiacus]MBV4358085.1 DNRLRE domain-containing protein [Pinibacter aurantiacus]
MKKVLLLLSAIPLLTISCRKSHDTDPTQKVTKTITIQPDASTGQDCTVAYRETDGGVRAAGNMNALHNLVAARATWNASGAGEGTERGYIKFAALDTIPQKATIKSAKLYLYGVESSSEITAGNSVYPGSNYSSFGDNKTWLKRVTANWDQTTINWNNKPGTVEDNKVELPVSTMQWGFDVTDIDVTAMVQDMVTSNHNYGFCLQLQVEQIYRFLLFGTCEVANASKRPKLVVTYEYVPGEKSNTPQPVTKTSTMQPGADKGQDCTVAYRETDGGARAAGNMNALQNLVAARATWNASGAGEGSERGYIKFVDIDSIPAEATIKSAKLSLYGVDASISPEITAGNSYYPGSGYASYGDNKTWLKRVAANWDQATINWNNKPVTVEENKVELPYSATQWNFDVTDIDVTAMVQDMVTKKQNYGFCFQLQVEQIYRFLVFGTSEVANAAKRPKLVVTYEYTPKN